MAEEGKMTVELSEADRERIKQIDALLAKPLATDDPINPQHYQGFSNNAEVIDIAEHLTFNRGAAVKYLSRAGNKVGADEIQDLRKALWFVNREIQRVEGKNR